MNQSEIDEVNRPYAREIAECRAEGIPVLPAYKVIDYAPSWTFWCVHCRINHWHGTSPGHRWAHCWISDSPYHEKGYCLEFAGVIADEKEIRPKGRIRPAKPKSRRWRR